MKDIIRYIKKVYEYIVSDIPYGIKNLIHWFPVIWSDRNWDNSFIFRVLKKKLELTEPVLRHGHCVYGYKRADKIKICIILLQRLLEDNYHENVFKRHEQKWGKLNMSFEKDKETGFSTIKFDRCNIKNEKDEKIEIQESKRLYKDVVKIQKQDVDYLFTIMKKHILGWWD